MPCVIDDAENRIISFNWDIRSKNPNLDFSIKRELPVLIQGRHFKRLTRAQTFSLSERRQAPKVHAVNFRRSNTFSWLRLSLLGSLSSQNSFKFIRGDWIRGLFQLYSKFRDCTRTNINTKFDLLLISCLIYLGSKFLFTNFWHARWDNSASHLFLQRSNSVFLEEHYGT